MARANSTGRNKDRWVGLTHGMLESAAFRSLSTHAIALLIQIEKRYNGLNNGNIEFSCREAMDYLKDSTGKACSKNTANKAFRSLEERGFIKIGKKSSFNMKGCKGTRWILTRWPFKEGLAPTNEWRDWKPRKKNMVSCQGQSVLNKRQELVRESSDSPIGGTYDG